MEDFPNINVKKEVKEEPSFLDPVRDAEEVRVTHDHVQCKWNFQMFISNGTMLIHNHLIILCAGTCRFGRRAVSNGCEGKYCVHKFSGN